jgi:hypothetical protein
LEVAAPPLSKPAVWAAAAEYWISKQENRDMTQAAVGTHYKVGLPTLLPRIKQMQKALNLQELDERYSDLSTTQIVYEDDI